MRRENVRAALERWCSAHGTGALRLLEPPGGALYLADGLITHAECPVAPSFHELLSSAVSEVELEMVALSALFGAALFQLDAIVATRFDPDDPSPIETTHALEVAAFGAEIDRRWSLLTDAWPDERVDATPVRPVPRLDGHQVALTALQWEIVANAHRGLSPMELARVLGRDPFAVLLQARRMARTGLLATAPRPVPTADQPPPERDRLPRRQPTARAHQVPHRRSESPGVPVNTLLRIRRGLEEQL